MKWNKDREQIENQLALNKQKSNKGNIQELRQHRKLTPAIDGRREIYPKSTRRRRLPADTKYGRWLPEHRYNVDQVPLPLVISQEKTYETGGSKQVWVSQPSS